MIEFTDSFSQAAVAEGICAHPALAKLISQQLMLPGFAYAHDVEGRRIGGPQPGAAQNLALCQPTGYA
ncbi:hypothetical protein [Aeromonas dhakensis]|uniref:hypothetical protein n=1 Tax=Aeromonas dhakensis TaxID=196024 RepID=UPI0021A9F7F0|nr:hypothetical protein [Aeromonas dhakensis]